MAAEPLLIVGAGGFARETAAALAAINDAAPRWRFLGFLDDDPARQGTDIDGHPVLGPTTAIAEHPSALVVVCIVSPRNYAARQRVVDRLALDDSRYATVVHPGACIGSGTRLGHGTVVLAGTVTTTAVYIAEHVAVMPSCVFTHDDHVERFATFGAGVRLAGGVTIGEGAYVGSGVHVRESLTVGAWSLLGMGALVLQSVPAAEVWVGAPAHHLRPASPGGIGAYSIPLAHHS